MRWRDLRKSENIEDRRAEGGGGVSFPGGGGRFPVGGSGGLVVAGILIFGADPRAIMQGGPTGDGTTIPDIRLPQSRPDATNLPLPGGYSGAQIQRPQGTAEDDLKSFVAAVLGTTEDVWRNTFAQHGQRYSDPTLVLFSGGAPPAVWVWRLWGRFIVLRMRKFTSISISTESSKTASAPLAILPKLMSSPMKLVIAKLGIKQKC